MFFSEISAWDSSSFERSLKLSLYGPGRQRAVSQCWIGAGGVSVELTDGLSQSDDHFLACGELGDPAHDSLHSVHPNFQLHGPHPEALIPPGHKGGTLRIFVHLWRKQRRFIINDTIQCFKTIITIPTLCGTTSHIHALTTPCGFTLGFIARKFPNLTLLPPVVIPQASPTRCSRLCQ